MKPICFKNTHSFSFQLIGFMILLAFTNCTKDDLSELSSTDITMPSNMITTRSPESVLTAGIPNDNFGICVATVGNTVYVGARTTGKVYEYTKTGGTYTLINEIAPDPATLNFASTVSVSGSWLAISASLTAAQGGGKVFMYKKQGNAWVQKAILTGPAGNNNFGALRGVGLAGNTLMVHSTIPGIPATLTSTISVFTLSGNEWSLQQEIVQPGIFFNTLKLDESGDRIATASGQGNAFSLPRTHIYVRNGSTWTLEDEVIINLPNLGAALEVAINGNTVVLLPVVPGTIHLVITNNGGDWELSQQLVIPAGAPNRRCFAQIEGEKLIIGAQSGNNTIPDEVYVFENFSASWDLTETLTPGDLGVNASIASVGLEGNTIIAGCPGATGFPGKVYVFE